MNIEIIQIVMGVVGVALIVFSILKSRNVNRKLLSVLWISFLIFFTLSWIIPVGTYSGGKLTTNGISPVGFADLFNKPVSTEIAVVKIAIKIINPYRLLTLGNVFFITYTTGISRVEKFTSTFINNKNTHIEIIEIIIELTIEIIIICLSLFKKFFKLIKTGINKIKL